MRFFTFSILLITSHPSILTAEATEPGLARVRPLGPLRVHPTNPRYFADGTGRAILLVGMHTWPTLVDMGPANPPKPFDFDRFLEVQAAHNHNFLRLWTWESTSWDTRGNDQDRLHHVRPLAYARLGPGLALDGRLKFDLTTFDPNYFQRLRDRVAKASEKNVYVSVMLFEGWAMQHSPEAWRAHPFHPGNNINNVNGDPNDDGKGLEVHTLANPDVTAVQEAYVRKVIETVNDLDNVLYEVGNEVHPDSTPWQSHMIRFVKEYERAKPAQHPVGMTFQYKGGSNRTLFDSPADWISPNGDGGYREDPPVADGRKVILSDTDHLWGIGGSADWVWKSVCRGHNPLFMDPYDGQVLNPKDDPRWEPIRLALGQARRLASKLDLSDSTPQPRLSSTGYCLANTSGTDPAFLIYAPKGGEVVADLTATPGRFVAEWWPLTDGSPHPGVEIEGGASRSLRAPEPGPIVLYLARRS